MAEMIWNAAVSVYNFIMDNIVLINIFLALVIVFFQRRSPQTVWTWLLLLYFIPILGFVMYLIIGQDFHKSRMFKAKAVLTDNNDIRVYTDGKEKFRALIEEMKQAKRYIHMQYYIIRNDELWQEVEKVLIQKAREGVEVRVLFDSMGCRTMKNRDWERLEKEGIQVAEFFPALLGQLQLRVN